MAHTKGPWKWTQAGGGWWVLLGGNGETVCDDGSACGEYNREIDPDGPNARLIAAAPDLLEALKALRDKVADYELGHMDDPEMLAADAAIAKAEGREG